MRVASEIRVSAACESSVIAGEVRRALNVEAADAITGGRAHVPESAVSFLQRRQARLVTFDERDIGDADDVGLSAGEREHVFAAAADHDRRIRTLHR